MGLNLGNYNIDDLWQAYRNNAISNATMRRSPRPIQPASAHDPRIVDPYPNAPSLRSLSPQQAEQDRILPRERYLSPEQLAVEQSNRQYETDMRGWADAAQVAKNTAMLPAASLASNVTATLGGLGAAGGTVASGGSLGDAGNSYVESFYNTRDKADQGLHELMLGDDQLSQLISEHGVEPVTQYLVSKGMSEESAGRAIKNVFDASMILGIGAHGKVGRQNQWVKDASGTLEQRSVPVDSPVFNKTKYPVLGGIAAASIPDLSQYDQKSLMAALGTVAVTESRSPIKQQIFELQKAIRETPDPVKKADLGRQIKELQQSKPTQNLPAPVEEKPLIDPEGPTFQLKSLNAINQLNPEMKLNGPQLYKHLKRNGVSDAEIDSVLGDIKTVGPITTAARWASQVEQSAPKINVDVYGGKSRTEKPYVIQTGDNEFTVYDPDTHTELMTSSTMEGARTYANSVNLGPSKPAIYQSWFKDDIVKFGSDPSTYQVAQLGVELPGSPQTLDAIAQEMFGKNHAQLGTDAKRIVFDEYLHRSESGRYVSPSWKNEHGEIDTPNSLAGFITSETKLPSGETVTVMHEGQPAKPVREQALSVEQTAKKLAAGDKFDWSKLSDLDKRSYLRDAEAKKALNPVPEPLAERAMELAAKQMIAQAKAAGHEGILLSTGEDVIKRWSSALQGVADEARYNPETQELKLYKNGSPSVAQSQVPAKVPPEKLKDYVGGQEAADRLLASETEQQMVSRNDSFAKDENGLYFHKDTGIYADNYYVLTDLSIDKRWPTVEYGRWEGGDTVKTPSVDKIDKATFDSVRSKFLNDFPDADGHIKRFLLDIADSKKEIDNLSNSTVRWLDASDLDLPTIYDWLSENYGVTNSTGGKYIPGKVANTLKRLTGGEIELVDVGGKAKLDYDQRYDEVINQNPEIRKMMSDIELNKDFVNEPSYEGARKYFFEDNEDFMDDARELTDTVYEHIVNNPDSPVAIKLMGKYWAGSNETSRKQPFLRFTKDTPKTFSIYEWAAITGVTAGLVKEYLDADDDKKKRMASKIPALKQVY